jgi:hypothetical protein
MQLLLPFLSLCFRSLALSRTRVRILHGLVLGRRGLALSSALRSTGCPWCPLWPWSLSRQGRTLCGLAGLGWDEHIKALQLVLQQCQRVLG